QGEIAAMTDPGHSDLRRLVVLSPSFADVLRAVLDVSDRFQATRTVVSMAPRFTIAIASADVGLNVSKARIHERLGLSSPRRARQPTGAVVKGHDYRARVGSAMLGPSHPHRDLGAIGRGISLSGCFREARDVGLGRRR